MPEEFSRTTKRKTIVLPSGDLIKVPVITKIAFIDPYQQYQESEHALDNTELSTRKVHVDRLHPVFPVDRDGVPTEDPPNQDDAQDLFIERIDTWNAVDPYERYQETQLTLDNATGNDLLPPHFTNHEKTHIYRYYQDPANPDDDGIWADAELIDEFSVIDPYQQNQETHYILKNPTNEEFDAGDLSGQANADDPDITIAIGEGEGTEDNPVRLDPFQNIVNYSGDIWIVIGFTVTGNLFQALSPATGPPPNTAFFRDVAYLSNFTAGLTFDTTSAAVVRTNGDTFDAEGATWSYSGGTTAPLGTFNINQWFPNFAFAVVEDAPTDNFYQDFKTHQFTGQDPEPVFFNTLSVVLNGWAFAGDELLYALGPTPVGFIQSATIPDPPGAGAGDIFTLGAIFGTRTFDFANINVSYKGGIFKSVAVVFATHGQSIQVLCKKQTT